MTNEEQGQYNTEHPLAKREARKAVIDWATLPPNRRSPKTQRELAEVLGVSETIVSRWINRSDVQEIIRRRRGEFLEPWDTDVMEALVESAMLRGQGGAADRKLFFQMRGYLGGQGQTVQNVQVNNVAIMGDKALVKVMATELSQIMGGGDEERERLEEGLMRKLERAEKPLEDVLFEDVDYEELFNE